MSGRFPTACACCTSDVEFSPSKNKKIMIFPFNMQPWCEKRLAYTFIHNSWSLCLLKFQKLPPRPRGEKFSIFSITTVYHDVLSDCLGNTDQKHHRRKWYRITDTFCEYRKYRYFRKYRWFRYHVDSIAHPYHKHIIYECNLNQFVWENNYNRLSVHDRNRVTLYIRFF